MYVFGGYSLVGVKYEYEKSIESLDTFQDMFNNIHDKPRWLSIAAMSCGITRPIINPVSKTQILILGNGDLESSRALLFDTKHKVFASEKSIYTGELMLYRTKNNSHVLATNRSIIATTENYSICQVFKYERLADETEVIYEIPLTNDHE